MSLLGRLFGGGKKSVRISVTEIGKQKLEQVAGESGIKMKIMSYLDESGASTVNELANSHDLSGYGIERIKMAVNQLYRDGWVQMVRDSSV